MAACLRTRNKQFNKLVISIRVYFPFGSDTDLGIKQEKQRLYTLVLATAHRGRLKAED